MTLADNVGTILANCAHVPQLPFNLTLPPAHYQIRYPFAVSRGFFRSSKPLTLVWDCPSPPAVVEMRFYEDFDNLPDTDPLVRIWGFLATCSSPYFSLGTSAWLLMATHAIQFSNRPGIIPAFIHVQHAGTNAGSIGLINYLQTPP